MYSIGEVANIFDIPVSTLRYYDKEGLFPHLQRQGNVRMFSDEDLEGLRVIECLKKSGLEIKEIRHFMDMVLAGPESYSERKQMFETRRAVVQKEMESLKKTLALLEYKCWYYTQLEAGEEPEALHARIPHDLPEAARKAYLASH